MKTLDLICLHWAAVAQTLAGREPRLRTPSSKHVTSERRHQTKLHVYNYYQMLSGPWYAAAHKPVEVDAYVRAMDFRGIPPTSYPRPGGF